VSSAAIKLGLWLAYYTVNKNFGISIIYLYIKELVGEALQGTEEGIKVGERLIKALRFAVDQRC